MNRAQRLLTIARREIAGMFNKVFSVALVEASEASGVKAAIGFWNGKEAARENREYPNLETACKDLERLARECAGHNDPVIIIDDI